MRTIKRGIGFFLLFVSLCLVAQTGKKTTVTGTLTRMMAIGGESSGWAIELDDERNIGGKSTKSIEIVYTDTARLEKLKDKRVRATGRVDTRKGVETGERTVLNVTSIKLAKSAPHTASTESAFSLAGSEWQLEDLAGEKVLEDSPATLSFPEAGKAAGRGSCNRFSGAVEISGDSIKFGPLVSTRMACPEPVMSQETKYLAALQAAERFEWKSPNLLVHCKSSEKSLRFTRVSAPKPMK